MINDSVSNEPATSMWTARRWYLAASCQSQLQVSTLNFTLYTGFHLSALYLGLNDILCSHQISKQRFVYVYYPLPNVQSFSLGLSCKWPIWIFSIHAGRKPDLKRFKQSMLNMKFYWSVLCFFMMLLWTKICVTREIRSTGSPEALEGTTRYFQLDVAGYAHFSPPVYLSRPPNPP